jgi:REP element-mobilizing transposase RayT
MNRGVRRRKIFFEDNHCLKFLDVLGEAVERFGVEVHAYSLMPNHYHLLLRIPEGNLSLAMRHINGIYTQWLNTVKKWDGPVFRGRFTSQLVEEEDYLRLLLAYIHLNPLKAHLVRRLDSGAWTSHRAYLGKDSSPSYLTTETMIGLFGDTARLHAFVRSVHTQAVCYPDDFNPETGLFSRKTIAKRIQRYNQKPELAEAQKQSRFQKSDEVLEQVMRISGTDLEEIMTTSKGRPESQGCGGNPFRFSKPSGQIGEPHAEK